jgi:hypothetical protein
MDNNIIESITILRIIVGFLGEKENFGWWQSEFFTQGSQAFLSPIFSRTQLLAQANGVTQAAALVHDEFIGVGNVYHLFRLPEEFEQRIHNFLLENRTSFFLADILETEKSAMRYLENNSAAIKQKIIGPTSVGSIQLLYKKEILKEIAGYYLLAFDNNKKIYPYLTSKI